MPLRKTKPSEQLALEKPSAVFADLSDNNAVSSYDARVYCQDAPFLIQKASQGLDFVDDTHAERCEATHLQGRPVGHYHFIGVESDPAQAVKEARHFTEVIDGHLLLDWPGKPKGYRSDFLIVDFEVPCADPRGTLSAFCHWLHKDRPNFTIIGYASYFAFLEQRLTVPSGLWWLAAYPGPISGKGFHNDQKLWAHQYTNLGRVSGVSTLCDKSVLVKKSSIKYWT